MTDKNRIFNGCFSFVSVIVFSSAVLQNEVGLFLTNKGFKESREPHLRKMQTNFVLKEVKKAFLKTSFLRQKQEWKRQEIDTKQP